MIDEFSYELGKRAASGGGGEAVLIDKTISTNGTYNASNDNADGYKKAVVNVPNSYAAGDEGKVVSNGALVSQTAHAEVNTNGTIDTTLNNSVVVNVPTGGGGYGYTKLAEQDFTVNTSSTSETSVGTINCGTAAWTKDKILYVRVRDKAGPRPGYFLETDNYVVNHYATNPDANSNSLILRCVTRKNTSGTPYGTQNNTSTGVYPSKIDSDGTLTIKAKYSSSTSGTIDGTYHVDVYLLDWPDGVSPFTT